MFHLSLTSKYFLPYQIRWLNDKSPLRICQKGRQVGISYVDQYDSVIKAAVKGHSHDVWVVSRDEIQSKQYIQGCKRWARILNYAANDLGEQIFTLANGQPIKVQVLTFATGASIYALSSNPDAIVGKTGHVKLDEFALHKDQRTLYAVAKPVTQWGGTVSIISTHRGPGTMFNQIITRIKEGRDHMHWSLHTIPIQLAVSQGLVEKINATAGTHQTRQSFLHRLEAECIDKEQWNQEYCCIPADENSAFISYDMLNACDDSSIRLLTLEQFLEYAIRHPQYAFYLGLDLATRDRDLCVIDVGEKIGDVVYDRLRIELTNTPIHVTRDIIYRLLHLPSLKRACIDGTGMGIQLGAELRRDFGWKAEPLDLTNPFKEELAFALRAEFEERRLRTVHDDKLRADLRSLKKLVTATGKIRFDGNCDDSHCDRFWALALRQHAARYQPTIGALLG
jgi:phage FluMu gp28-like protein